MFKGTPETDLSEENMIITCWLYFFIADPNIHTCNLTVSQQDGIKLNSWMSVFTVPIL